MAETYRMGPARITLNSAVQAWLTRGCKVTITPTLKEMKFDQTGDTPYDDLLTGAAVDVEIVVAVSDEDDMAAFLAWATKITDGTKVLIDGVIDIGLSMRTVAVPLLLHPLDLIDADVSNDVYIPKVVCVSGFQKIFEGTNEDVFTSKWKGYIDNTTTKRLFQIGDTSASADTTPPTVSSSVPVDDATGVAKASGLHIDFVMSEDIDPATVVKGNTLISKATDQTAFTNYTVEYISASHTIRITTGAALAAETEYMANLTTGIKDVNGNALAAPFMLTFTSGA